MSKSRKPPKRDPWMALVIADGAAIGAALMAAGYSLEWAARHGLGPLDLLELPRLMVSAWAPVILVGGMVSLAAGKARFAVLVLAAIWIPRQTRGAARVLTAAALATIAAWGAAVACAMVFLLQPGTGLLVPAIGLLLAALLSRRHAWSVTAMVLLSAGAVVGAVTAQLPVIASYAFVASADGYEHVRSPLYGFLPVIVPALAAAWVVSHREFPATIGPKRRLIQYWGLCTVCLSIAVSIAVEMIQLSPGPPTKSARGVLDEFAYDIHVAGTPAALLWTNRNRLQVIDDVYGETPSRRVLDRRLVGLVEWITPSLDGGFYVPVDQEPKIAWWKPVEPSERIPYAPSGGWLRVPDWVQRGMSQLQLAPDPVAGHLLVFSQVQTRYAVVDRASNTTLATGVLSDSPFSGVQVATDTMRRVALITSVIKDGAISEFDFATLQVTRRVPNRYVMMVSFDPSGDLLWGIRPFTGELVGLDRHTLQIRHRVPLEPALRSLVQDPDTGMLYTCSFLFGGIDQVDPKTLAATRLGWCGRLCRSLHLDSAHHTLWVATADRICRIPLDEGPPADQS